MPQNLESIGSHAFDGCSSLQSIIIPEGVTVINDYSFQNCTSLASIELPQNLESIGRYAFDYCNSLAVVLNYSGLEITKGSSAYGYVAYYAKVVIKCDENTDITVEKINGVIYINNKTTNEFNAVGLSLDKLS